VSVSRRPGGFLTTVVDDGCGFDPVMLAHAAPEHHGLLAMRERAEDAGGWFRVDSSPGSGTRVQFFVPEAPA
jgi:signal transduction histidine kinase